MINVTGIGCQPLMKNNPLNSVGFKGKYDDVDLSDSEGRSVFQDEFENIDSQVDTADKHFRNLNSKKKEVQNPVGKFLLKAGTIGLFAGVSGLLAKGVVLNKIAKVVIDKTRIGEKCMPAIRNIFDGLTDFMAKQGKKSSETIANQVNSQDAGKIKQFLVKGKNLISRTYNKAIISTSGQFKKLVNNTEDGLLKEIAVGEGITDYGRANNIVKDDNLLNRIRKALISDLKDKKFADIDNRTFEVEINEIKRQITLPKLSEEMIDEAKRNKLAGKVVGKVTGNVALVGGAATGAVEATKLDDDNLEAEFGKKVKSVGTIISATAMY